MAMTTAGNVGPFQAGANTGILDAMWQRVMPQFFRDGVIVNYLNKLNVTAGAGLQVLVDTGVAIVTGIWCYNDASAAFAVAAADITNPRKDLVVVHVNRTNATDGAGVAAFSANIVILTGTPSGSPVIPSVTQNANTWEIALFSYSVLANAGAPSSFVDARTYTPNFPQIYQQSGVAETGVCGGQVTATATNQVWGWVKDFKRTMQVAPSSITLVTVTATNANTQTAATLRVDGFLYTANAPLAQLMTTFDTYSTVGNSIRRVGRGSFDIHCDAPITDRQGRIIGAQDHLVRGRSLKDLEVLDSGQYFSSKPGEMALRHVCPECGAVECFNTALDSADEHLLLPDWQQRMEQAYLIRQMQAALHLPMLA